MTSSPWNRFKVALMECLQSPGEGRVQTMKRRRSHIVLALTKWSSTMRAGEILVLPSSPADKTPEIGTVAHRQMFPVGDTVIEY